MWPIASSLQFKLDDEALEALKDELIYSQQLAVDAEGKVLVWADSSSASYSPLRQPRTGRRSPTRHPISPTRSSRPAPPWRANASR